MSLHIQLDFFSNASGTKREHFFDSRLCNRHRTPGGECRPSSRYITRIPLKGEMGSSIPVEHPQGSITEEKHDLAVNLVYWLKFLTQQRRKDIMLKKKKGTGTRAGMCKHTPTLFPHLRPAAGL